MNLSSDLVYIAVEGGMYQPYRIVNGIYRLPVGEPVPTPRSAVRYADNLERGMSPTSPLRVSAEPSPPVAVPQRSGQ